MRRVLRAAWIVLIAAMTAIETERCVAFGPAPYWIETARATFENSLNMRRFVGVQGWNRSAPEIRYVSDLFRYGFDEAQFATHVFASPGDVRSPDERQRLRKILDRSDWPFLERAHPLADILGHASAGVSSEDMAVSFFTEVRIGYSFMVVPKDAQTPMREVPVLYRSLGHVSYEQTDLPLHGDFKSLRVEARLKIDGEQVSQAVVKFSHGEFTRDKRQEFDHVGQFLELPGGVHTIEALARASGYSGQGSGFSAEFQSLISPAVVIDPSFPFKADYVLVFNTPHILPTGDVEISAIPEPYSIALLAIGSLAVAGFRRRNRWATLDGCRMSFGVSLRFSRTPASSEQRANNDKSTPALTGLLFCD